jgi:hypothetical protein
MGLLSVRRNSGPLHGDRNEQGMNGSIGIHTICYAPGMAASIDAAFRPFDASASPEAERREIAHMLAFWRQGRHREHAVSGLLSPKFGAKTRMSGTSFIDFIAANPGYDVWFVNPFPHLRYLSFNIWEQGEFWHAGLGERARKLFAAAGMEFDIAAFPRSTAETLLFSNFWAATPQFWDRFMAGVEALTKASETLPDIFDQASHYTPTSYFPFIFERYFTTFLLLNSDVRACPWKHSFDETLQRCSSEMEYLLIREWAPMIDRWDARGAYDEDQRQIFRSLQKFCGLFQNMKRHAEAALARRGP